MLDGFSTQVGESSEEDGCELLTTLSAVLDRVTLAAEVSTLIAAEHPPPSVTPLSSQDLPGANPAYAMLPFLLWPWD